MPEPTPEHFMEAEMLVGIDFEDSRKRMARVLAERDARIEKLRDEGFAAIKVLRERDARIAELRNENGEMDNTIESGRIRIARLDARIAEVEETMAYLASENAKKGDVIEALEHRIIQLREDAE